MLSFLNIICPNFACTSSHTVAESVSKSTNKIHPITSTSTLERAIKNREIANVRIELSELNKNASLSKEFIELFKQTFFTPFVEEDDFTSQVQKELIKFILNKQFFDEKTIIDEGKTLEQLLREADERNGTQLTMFLAQQIKPLNPEDMWTVTTGSKLTGQNSVTDLPTDHIFDLGKGIPYAISSLDLVPPQKTSLETTKAVDRTPKVIKNFKLLVVEDSYSLIKAFLKKFVDSDIDVYWTNTSEEGLKAMQGEIFFSAGHRITSSGNTAIIYTTKELIKNQGVKFDVVLHDFELGNGQKSGPESVAEYRAFENARNLPENPQKRLPILTFSTNANTTDLPIAEEHRANFDGIVDKPGSSTQTFQALHAVLGDEYIQWSIPETSTTVH